MSTPAATPATIPSAAGEDDPCHRLRREPGSYWNLCLTVDRGTGNRLPAVVVGLDIRSEQLALRLRFVPCGPRTP